VQQRERFAFFRRWRPARRPFLLYDPALIAGQIAENLERARQMCGQRLAFRDRPRFLLTGNVDGVQSVTPISSGGPLNERRMDRRVPQRSPWVWAVQLPGGGTADVVNISRSGILIELRSLVSPGVTLDLCVNGAGVSACVPARFVRSEVARVEQSGPFYHAAAHFEQPFAMPGLRPELPPQKTLRALKGLLAAVVADSNELEAAAAPLEVAV